MWKSIWRKIVHTGNMSFGGGSIILWGCFSFSGTGNLVKVVGIRKKEGYVKILKENLKQSGAELGLGLLLCLPTEQWPKIYITLSEGPPEDQSESYWLACTKPWLKFVEWTEDQGPCQQIWESAGNPQETCVRLVCENGNKGLQATFLYRYKPCKFGLLTSLGVHYYYLVLFIIHSLRLLVWLCALVGKIITLNCSSDMTTSWWEPCMSGERARSWATSKGSGRGAPWPSRTTMPMTGARCMSWISLAGNNKDNETM